MKDKTDTSVRGVRLSDESEYIHGIANFITSYSLYCMSLAFGYIPKSMPIASFKTLSEAFIQFVGKLIEFVLNVFTALF